MLTDHAVSPALLEAVVRSATDAIVAVDERQRIVLFNAAAEAMFQCPVEEALGTPLDRFLPERFRDIHRRHVAAFAKTGSTARAMGHLRPLAARRATGEEFPIEATIARAVVDGKVYLAAIVRDVTNVLRIEAEFRRRAELLDNAHDAVLAWDWHGKVTYWNRGAERLYGYTAREALHQESQSLLGLDPGAARSARTSLERDGHWEGEQAHRTRDGRRVLVESRQVLIREGDTGYILAANRDITARRTAERERAESLARETAARFQAEVSAALANALRLETTLERIAEVVVRVLADGCFVDIVDGDQIRRMAALHREPSKQTVLQEIARRYPPDWDSPLPGSIALRSGEPVLIPHLTEDSLVEHTVDEEHRRLLREVGVHAVLAVPMMLRDRVVGSLTILASESERRLGTVELQQAKALAERAAIAIENARLHEEIEAARRLAERQSDRLRAILDNLPMAVILLSPPEGGVPLANAAANALIFGDAAWKGASLSNLDEFRLLQIDGTPLPRESRPGLRALRNMTVRNQQLLLEGADGRTTPVLVQATPLGGSDGEAIGAVLVLQDITRLREAEQLKDDFLALLSHEFRTPLTAIHGGAQLLTTDGASLDEETRRELIADIVTESERLDQMLGNLLSLADILAGRLQPATEPVLVEPLLRASVREMARRVATHRFVIDVPPGVPPIEADPALCGQILRNVYENAVKYAPGGGEIRTAALVVDGMVRVSVTDQGIGIAPEYVDTVFERFRRVGGDPAVRGMGLGLYLVRHLVEAQGGRVQAHSPGVGEGATITIDLPVAEAWEPDDGEA